MTPEVTAENAEVLDGAEIFIGTVKAGEEGSMAATVMPSGAPQAQGPEAVGAVWASTGPAASTASPTDQRFFCRFSMVRRKRYDS